MLNFDEITALSQSEEKFSSEEVDRVLDKALRGYELSLEELVGLMNIEEEEELKKLHKAALTIKEKVFGNRIVLFAPLYLSNECSNKCLYCAFQSGNDKEKRKTLTIEEAIKEANHLVKRGFKRTLLVTAENKAKCGVEYIVNITKALYQNTGLKIIHLNAAPMEVEELKEIRASGIGVYQVFQETYHKQTYESLHLAGKKKDFNYRLTCMARAIEAGFKDVGIGALLGLYNYKFDVLAVIAHGRQLKKHYGTYPHTISVPRFRRALGSPMEEAFYPVDDKTFKKIVSLYRIAIPTAGVVISTREPAYLRDEVLTCGASQISAESSTSPGGYTGITEEAKASQFTLSDRRSLEEIILAILERGMLPSFCTACYRKGREGGAFHQKAQRGEIKKYCEHNAYTTLIQYLNTQAEGPIKDAIKNKLDQLKPFENTQKTGGLR